MRKFLLLFIVLGLCTKIEALPYTFSLVPREISMQGHKTTIRLSLILDKAFDRPGTELRADHHNGKTRFVYSRALRSLMKELNLDKSDFSPFRAYLRQQIKKAKKSPARYLTLLSSFLTTGTAPQFRVNIRK